ncbi:MAG TPA: GNAT family N-acetyltransferase [Gaiellaceae bacterium]|jgi:ribosomal protein S18 acetylase RimI-like enzyme
MSDFSIRPATEADRRPLVEMFAEVVEENVGLGTEPPVDVDARAASWNLDNSLVAEAEGKIVGSIHAALSRHGYAEIGMAVAREWRGKGVGSALLSAAEEFARQNGAHKLSLDVFAHNERAIALYTKHGFVVEGRRVKHYRRKNGELFDSLEMGKLLD